MNNAPDKIKQPEISLSFFDINSFLSYAAGKVTRLQCLYADPPFFEDNFSLSNVIILSYINKVFLKRIIVISVKKY